MLDATKPEGDCGLRNGQGPRCCSAALLPEGTWDVGTVRQRVDLGAEQEHTRPSASCDRGSPSLGPWPSSSASCSPRLCVQALPL